MANPTAVTLNYLDDGTPSLDITVYNKGTVAWPVTTIINAYYLDGKTSYSTSFNPSAEVTASTGSVNFSLTLGASTTYSPTSLFVGVTIVTTSA